MITPFIVGQIFGMTFLILGLSMIFNRRSTALAMDKMLKDNASMWRSGFFSLLIGSFILAFSNFSNGTLTSTLAVIGILSFLKGTFILCFPRFSERFYRNSVNRPGMVFIAGLISLVLSILLITNSF
ncbi:MAG: hypothetical protein RI945_117 [Candidatus Parcubacteria bacterium]|jgi:hypothetical protein